MGDVGCGYGLQEFGAVGAMEGEERAWWWGGRGGVGGGGGGGRGEREVYEAGSEGRVGRCREVRARVREALLEGAGLEEEEPLAGEADVCWAGHRCAVPCQLLPSGGWSEGLAGWDGGGCSCRQLLKCSQDAIASANDVNMQLG